MHARGRVSPTVIKIACIFVYRFVLLIDYKRVFGGSWRDWWGVELHRTHKNQLSYVFSYRRLQLKVASGQTRPTVVGYYAY